jgi:hypothetical protein
MLLAMLVQVTSLLLLSLLGKLLLLLLLLLDLVLLLLLLVVVVVVVVCHLHVTAPVTKLQLLIPASATDPGTAAATAGGGAMYV